MHKNDVPKNPELMLVRLNALLTSSIFHNVHLLLQFTFIKEIYFYKTSHRNLLDFVVYLRITPYLRTES